MEKTKNTLPEPLKKVNSNKLDFLEVALRCLVGLCLIAISMLIYLLAVNFLLMIFIERYGLLFCGGIGRRLSSNPKTPIGWIT